MENEPTERDWVALQGGKPSIVDRNTHLVDVVHDYEGGNGMVVPTLKPLLAMGTALFYVLDRVVAFPVALVRQLHGEPCEKQSNRVGGDRYERRRK